MTCRDIYCINCKKVTKHIRKGTSNTNYGGHWYCQPCVLDDNIIGLYPSITEDGKVCKELAVKREIKHDL